MKNEETTKKKDGKWKDMPVDAPAVNNDELIVIQACCCQNISIKTDDCIGCSAKAQFCCFTSAACCMSKTPKMGCVCCEQRLHKASNLNCCTWMMGTDREENNKIAYVTACEILQVSCLKTWCATCHKAQVQLCCLVVNQADGCDDEVPILCVYLGLACFPSFGCCMTQGELVASGKKMLH